MPIWFIAWMIGMFGYLLHETDWLKVNLIAKPKYARYEVYNILKCRHPRCGDRPIRQGGNLPDGYTPNGEPTYTIILSPGVNGVLCGWNWLNEHCADLVDYKPRIEMAIGGVKYNMHIKQPAIIKDIMRANKLTKKQKLAYA
jgi:hypothetical protein